MYSCSGLELASSWGFLAQRLFYIGAAGILPDRPGEKRHMIRNRKRGVRQIQPSGEMLEDRRLPSGLYPALAPPPAPGLFIEPTAGRAPIIHAIDSARSQIRLGICNISDPGIGSALIAAAGRGVHVQVIVDQADYHAKTAEQALVAHLIAGGVSVHLSNSMFPQSFEKDLIIDQRRVLIMTMCLIPQTFTDTRDYGVVLANPAVIRETTAVFNKDWAYSAPPGQPTPAFNPTPALHVPYLIWGPTNANAQLSRLIQSARSSLLITTELLDDLYLESQIIAAAQRGVRVRIITPLTTREGTDNSQAIHLLEANGVQVRITPTLYPMGSEPPYMHAKSIIVDGKVAYLGSIDIQTTEATQDRELGVILSQHLVVSRMTMQFQRDWKTALEPPPAVS